MIKQFLSCDWGTSNFRLRIINAENGSVLAETVDGKGIAVVYNEWLKSGLAEEQRAGFYKDVLLSQIKNLDNNFLARMPIIISGMASSSIGITELPYAGTPFAINSDNLNVQRISADEKFKHEIFIISGLKTNNDVMRGEETMLLGCGIGDDDEQLIIFPGTHSKHVTVQKNVVKDFKTYMTGEIFDLLSNKSILSKSVKKNESDKHQSIFEKGLKESVEGNLLNTIFHVRANQLFNLLSPEENYHYLSGLLIGLELKEIGSGKIKTLLVCSEVLYKSYWQALQILCGSDNVQYLNADRALIDGHCRLAKLFL